jgi:SRSO17 transposase
VAEVPVTFSAWMRAPQVTERPYRRGSRGRRRTVPRRLAGTPGPSALQELVAYSPILRDQEWIRYRVKDGEKGPLVWEVKTARITMKKDDGLPGLRLHLVVARNVLDPDEVKFFVSNAPQGTSVQTLLLVAFSRWRVERCFQDQKQEIGLDQWEGRHYVGLKRHLILSCISYLFLARVREQLRGKKPRANRLPGPRRRRRAGRELVA